MLCRAGEAKTQTGPEISPMTTMSALSFLQMAAHMHRVGVLQIAEHRTADAEIFYGARGDEAAQPHTFVVGS